MLVKDDRLVSIAHACHQFLYKLSDLLIAHPIRVRRIDGHMERRLLAAPGCSFVAFQRSQRVIGIINVGHIENHCVPCFHLILIIPEASLTVLRSGFNFYYHNQSDEISTEYIRRIQPSLPMGARSRFRTHTSRFT